MTIDPALLSAMSAVMGSLVGGAATFATAWTTQNVKSKQELIAADIQKREQLYGEFIKECSRLAIDALDKTLESPAKLFDVYALQNRIRLTASTGVVLAAEHTIRRILQQYFEPNIVLEQLKQLSLEGPNAPPSLEDPLKEFSEACRAELLSLHR